MAKAKLFVPPKLNSIYDFEDWLGETEIWQYLTDLDKKNQGPAIYLSFDENIRKTCCDIKVKDLNGDDGVDILLCKLKSPFAKDISQTTIIAYGKFEIFKRPANMNIVDFMEEFERLYNNIKIHDMELSTGVLAYRLLKSADISEDKQQLARPTMSSFTYNDMKKQLKAIYDNLSTYDIKGSNTEIKVEPTYEVKTYEKSDILDGYFSRGQNNAYRGSRGRGYNRFMENNQTSDTKRQASDSRRVNPSNQYGRISRAICQSIYHWFKDCPHNVQGSNSKVTLFTHEVQKCYVQNFLGETLNLAVLDSGCTKTVHGQELLKYYSDDDRKKIQEFISETEFKFGDGTVVASKKCSNSMQYCR